MSDINETGISPVLLQAISQTLTSGGGNQRTVGTTTYSLSTSSSDAFQMSAMADGFSASTKVMSVIQTPTMVDGISNTPKLMTSMQTPTILDGVSNTFKIISTSQTSTKADGFSNSPKFTPAIQTSTMADGFSNSPKVTPAIQTPTMADGFSDSPKVTPAIQTPTMADGFSNSPKVTSAIQIPTMADGFSNTPKVTPAIQTPTMADGFSNSPRVTPAIQTPTMADGFSNSPKVTSHVLQGMNQSVADLLRLTAAKSEEGDNPGQNPEDHENVRTALKWKLGQRIASQQEEKSKEQETIIITTSEADISMVNVLTALASHHLKSNPKPSEGPLVIESNNEQSEQDENKQVTVICYDNNTSVPSPANDIIIGDTDAGGGDGARRIVVQNSLIEEEVVTDSPTRPSPLDGTNVCYIVDSQMAEAIRLQAGGSTMLSGSLPPDPVMGPCPICGDNISGYHYGIFSCESCKGFFKRTVQNKKAFVCHRRGECEINKFNRKKCPSCRFTRCLVMGMRLEAIRNDRTRGGRSSYQGCSTHGRPKVPGEKKPKAARRIVPWDKISVGGPVIVGEVPVGEHGSQLVAMLSDGNTVSVEESKPYVPQVLTDIMNLESLMCDDELPSSFTKDKFSDDDPNMILSLLQLTELRLYKLVRWARNLPQFAAISTDDQILLLQNSWADLLALGCCYRSTSGNGEIRLSFGKIITEERAKQLGVEEVLSRMISLSEQLRRLVVDQYEYVGLKVLILICPDVKGLKEASRVHEVQEKISEALAAYTGSHYPQHPNKFGELLLRLGELSRISLIGKETINAWMPTSIASCGLLYELLKGENGSKET